METCPFNATHIYTRSERDYHLLNCSDKAPLDRKLAREYLCFANLIFLIY